MLAAPAPQWLALSAAPLLLGWACVAIICPPAPLPLPPLALLLPPLPCLLCCPPMAVPAAAAAMKSSGEGRGQASSRPSSPQLTSCQCSWSGAVKPRLSWCPLPHFPAPCLSPGVRWE
ncbi:hypothetical protein V8C86DRAFT_2589568 [Haematococcus lacustris]